VIVRINDRMHPRMKKKGRVVDMSQEAARELDYMEEGLVRVRVQPITFISADSVRPGDSIVINLDSLRIRDSIRIADSVAGRPGIPEASFKTGTASYYSAHFDGRKTANGEIFRNNKMTAASNDFDLNTWVRVTNLRNQRSVIVWINDRMHKKMQQKGRVVDLSRAAAKELGFIKAGLVKVTVEVVEPGTQE
jgi:rare lipoprotein A (peptidoglycan hydrolase)